MSASDFGVYADLAGGRAASNEISSFVMTGGFFTNVPPVLDGVRDCLTSGGLFLICAREPPVRLRTPRKIAAKTRRVQLIGNLRANPKIIDLVLGLARRAENRGPVPKQRRATGTSVPAPLTRPPNSCLVPVPDKSGSAPRLNHVNVYSFRGHARHLSGRSICSSFKSSWRTTNLPSASLSG